MAGYTTRILYTSTSSFVAICFTLIWYLRKKKLLALQSSNSERSISESNIPKTKVVENITPMNLKELSESTTQQSSSPKISEKMHLKEKSGASDKSSVSNKDYIHSNGSTVNGTCNNNQMCENGTTCVTQTLTNGSSHNSEYDNIIDKHCSASKVENNLSETSNSSCVAISELSNGLKSVCFDKNNTEEVLSTKDTIENFGKKKEEMFSNKESTDGEEAKNSKDIVIEKADSDEKSVTESHNDNKDILTNVNIENIFNGKLQNGDFNAELCKSDFSTDELPSYVSSDEVLSTDLVNKSSIDLSCDTNFERKTLTPDSGVPADLQECDSSSSTMSDNSSESPLNGVHSDVLKSPCVSESSNDSGKDGSQNFEVGILSEEILYYAEEEIASDSIHYDFSIPQELCGYLIGRNGRHVKYLVSETNAAINVNIHPFLKNHKVCTISGSEEEIKHALVLIREKFPLQKYPDLSLEALNPVQTECTLPVTICLALPEGVNFEVLLSATVTPGHFFLQQPSHPTYHTLSWLSQTMTSWYNQCDAPKLFNITIGHVVAAPIAGGWYRAEVTDIEAETEECTVKFLDFGGYAKMMINELRQMKIEFAYVPFQSVECLLGNVTYPEDEEGWSKEAKSFFEELAQGQILHGYIIAYNEGIPYVHLYKIQGATHVFINRELVNSGLARWIEHGTKV